MLDRGSHMNCHGMVDLMIQAVAHWLFGRSPNGHRPHRRGANHGGGGAWRWDSLRQILSFIIPALRRSFRKAHLLDYGHQRAILHVCDQSRGDADGPKTHTALPNTVRVHLAHGSSPPAQQVLLLLVAEHGRGRRARREA